MGHKKQRQILQEGNLIIAVCPGKAGTIPQSKEPSDIRMF